ncbi:MAG TPA: hypothetical protein VGI83_03620 [Gemmatimonadales bacterium]|jgi:hypothetical protein
MKPGKGAGPGGGKKGERGVMPEPKRGGPMPNKGGGAPFPGKRGGFPMKQHLPTGNRRGG